ncbi:multiple PDZ domain protein-like protein [Euroglyphus maynei]|uniref:Multiple PDZ domain protein-like protein n=1 Tax=Euroglyphus maynei TaxID=6958 RepID=A0A1Y3AUQ0_EURMA|nr:multiple PDZ domain protein-like protein [Euroglyphus maynei]
MIIEGKRPDVGRGVFVSDIQDCSPAENAGLSVGDMILSVNQIDLIGADYETAANALKCADGLLTLVIAKPIKLMPFEHQQQQQQSTTTTTKTASSNIADQNHHSPDDHQTNKEKSNERYFEWKRKPKTDLHK